MRTLIAFLFLATLTAAQSVTVTTKPNPVILQTRDSVDTTLTATCNPITEVYLTNATVAVVTQKQLAVTLTFPAGGAISVSGNTVTYKTSAPSVSIDVSATPATATISTTNVTVVAGHSVILNWQDAANTFGATYSVYRASDSCSAGSSFSKIASAVPLLSFDDNNVSVGTYCYKVTAIVGAQESVPSNQAEGVVPI